jgi:3-dehydroquinate dehydratase
MNIESKLRLLRKAKKRRVALTFHTRKIGGIDLNDEKLKIVLPVIKTLFRTLKAAKFEIEINHWGEIYLIEPERKIQLLLSVHDALNTKEISNIKKHFEGGVQYSVSA